LYLKYRVFRRARGPDEAEILRPRLIHMPVARYYPALQLHEHQSRLFQVANHVVRERRAHVSVHDAVIE